MFSSSKNRTVKRRMAKGNAAKKVKKSVLRSNLQVETLEDRKLMAVTNLSMGANGVLSVGCDDANDTIMVYRSGTNVMVRSTSPAGAVSEWNMGSSVSRLNIATRGGNDVVTNSTNLPASIYGGAGNDQLNGGSAADFIVGEAGDDVIRGNAGADQLYGADGNDSVYGGAGADDLYGGLGSDLMYGDDVALTPMINGSPAGNDRIFGNDGLDLIYGGFGNDLIYGGAGDDYLYGQDGNDRMFGEAGYDHLLGQNGDDFLDAGSANEYAIGNSGNDFDAYVTAVGGATFNDISQGNSNNCFILGAMGVATLRGINLASRITYAGNGNYNVSLFMRTTIGAYIPTTVTVPFDGTLRSSDPAAHFRGQEGESWPIIMNRALAKLLNVNLDTTTGGYAGDVLAAITGNRPTTQLWTDGSYNPLLPDGILSYLFNVANARPTIVSTTGAPARDGTLFAPAHVYMVHSVFISSYIYSPLTRTMVPQYSVLLYNPHGVDNRDVGSVATARSSGDNNDGLIQVTAAEFKRNFGEITLA